MGRLPIPAFAAIMICIEYEISYSALYPAAKGIEYQPEYAVAIASDEQGEDRLYGVKGISNSVANTLQRNLPAQIETVLLPFKGKIIYDSFMGSMPIGYAEGAKAAFREMYDKAIKHGIITSLE